MRRAGLEAAHAGQPDVEQHQVEPARGERLEAALPRLRPLGHVAVQAQQVQERLADVGVVVDDQDLGHGRIGSFAPVAAGVKAARYTSARNPRHMNQTSPPRDGLAQLAEAFRSRRTRPARPRRGAGTRCACSSRPARSWRSGPRRAEAKAAIAAASPTTRSGCGSSACWPRSACASAGSAAPAGAVARRRLAAPPTASLARPADREAGRRRRSPCASRRAPPRRRTWWRSPSPPSP